MSKLKNVKALNEMLSGNHRTQTNKTYGFSDTNATAERNKKREVGEIWEVKDTNGNSTWFEQFEGHRVKTNMHPSVSKMMQEMRTWLSSFPNCPKEKCTCYKPTRLDEKFRRIAGMCEECLISYETSLKMKGEFNEYALSRMKANADAFFKQADTEVEVLKREIMNINFAGDETDNNNVVEKWNFQDPESYKQMIDEQYLQFKERTLASFKTKRDEL
tara:strand:+ start:192 stop:842 length:651 start_codon:yes stop_codon:yes gene_type:complete